MATIINYSIKAEDLKGTVNEKGYINLTLEVKDEATDWGNNVIGYKSQTADQRKAKELKEAKAEVDRRLLQRFLDKNSGLIVKSERFSNMSSEEIAQEIVYGQNVKKVYEQG